MEFPTLQSFPLARSRNASRRPAALLSFAIDDATAQRAAARHPAVPYRSTPRFAKPGACHTGDRSEPPLPARLQGFSPRVESVAHPPVVGPVEARCSLGLSSSSGSPPSMPRANVAKGAPPTSFAVPCGTWTPREGHLRRCMSCVSSESRQHGGWPHSRGATSPLEVLPPHRRPERLGSRLALAH